MRPGPAGKQGRSAVGSEFQAPGLITSGLEGQWQWFRHSGTAWGLPVEPRHRKHPAEVGWHRGRPPTGDQEALGSLPHAPLHLPRFGAPYCEALWRQVEQELGSVDSTLQLCRAEPCSTQKWSLGKHQATLPAAQNFLCGHIAGPVWTMNENRAMPEACQVETSSSSQQPPLLSILPVAL